MLAKSPSERIMENTANRYNAPSSLYMPTKARGDDEVANFCLYDCPHADSKCRGTCPEIRQIEKEYEKKRRNTVQGASNKRRK